MESPDSNNCELPSEKYYHGLNSVTITNNSQSVCDSNENTLSGENPLSKYPSLYHFCYKLEENLRNLKNEEDKPDAMKKKCSYLKHWLHDNVINTAEIKSPIFHIMLLYTIWEKIVEKFKINNKNECETKHSFIGLDYHTKWKKMHDYHDNYKELKCVFQNKEDCKVHEEKNCKEICKGDCKEVCKEDCKKTYCEYFVDIFNIYKEFEHVCNNGTDNRRCPYFWETFKKNYSETSVIEELCQKVYEDHGYYKVKVSLDIEGEEKYVYQYESTYMFSFFEKLIGYSIKKILSKSLYYSKYILSLFGSKISPRFDDLRKMWRNVQGVTNPATLLNPMKPPGGGNKMGLPYLPK
ncbi:PIR Superfamily Protein [Plasmodium ovale curtisi]|uniref:PIR Superfamily Protein n=1 Tax=Plasmodium ovale curtisi TaxID=864141 RepID=A0A1A8WC78_PLAOA|nr:PIR Superfamily Protein [Plasmodium ovale curtisi]SBS99888.1 PIR Superfamily Protein [Plasmodium ovale curtisi]